MTRDNLDEFSDEDQMGFELGSVYQKIALLRRNGYSETYFSMSDPKQMEAYKELIAEMDALDADYHTFPLQGAHIVFLKPDTAELLGVQVRKVTDDILSGRQSAEEESGN